MAEFCLKCAKELLGFSDSEIRRSVLSYDREYCEGCGEFKPIVITVRPTFRKRLKDWLRSKMVDQ